MTPADKTRILANLKAKGIVPVKPKRGRKGK